jgi:hypothetical protein
MKIDITHPKGAAKIVEIHKFPAMEGWKIQEQFTRFAVSDDKKFKRDYVFWVLTYAKVIQKDGGQLPLSTDALINNHIGSWENIQKVFEAILIYNEIDPKTHAKRLHYWAKAGEEMAFSFMAAVFESEIVQDFKRKQNGKFNQLWGKGDYPTRLPGLRRVRTESEISDGLPGAV